MLGIVTFRYFASTRAMELVDIAQIRPKRSDATSRMSPARTTGAAPLAVRVRDASGSPVEHARVRVEYTMDMPGMTIESAEARELGAGRYEAAARFPMAGPWSVVISIERPGHPEARARFTLRVAG